MIFKDKGVQIQVETDFFDNLFEPKRRDLEKILGVTIGQKQFTSMIQEFKFKPKISNIFKNGTTKNNKKKR